jgi:oxidoreductase
MSKDLIALVTGYTGESGKALLQELIKSNQFKKIILVGRRQVDFTDNEYKEKTEQRQIDFDKIDDYPEAFHGAHIHFCCLGTTRSKAGTEGFRRVDFDYIVGAARLAKQEGCKQFHLLSSQGANPHSLFLYPKVKGQTETALTQMSFERLAIYRPAMLMVDRTEHRPFETFAQSIVRNTVQRVAPEWITTPIEVLARAMCFNVFIKDRPSIEILDNHAIFRLSEQQPFVTKEQSKATNES